MLLTFRQGLVTYQRDVGGLPIFLKASSTNPGAISVMVSPTPLTVTFAQGASDYLATFEETVDAAWTTLSEGQDNYLYIDMDMMTSRITFGSTTKVPVIGAGLTAPQIDDQHWFDHATTRMKVWSHSNQRWMDKIRVFVGKATSSQNIQQYTHGTTVGLNTRSDPGYPMLDTMLRPLRTSTGEFLTTNSNVRIKTTSGTSGVLAQPTNSFISVRAGENIPAMSLVYFSTDDTVSLASSDPALTARRTPIGIVKQALVTNEIGTITQYGDITYDQWDWTGHIGQAVYCDMHGKVTTVRPAGLLAYRVGFIKNKDTIILGIDAETEAQVYQAGPSQFVMNAVEPLSAEESMNPQGERVITVSIAPSSETGAGSMSSEQSIALSNATSDIEAHAGLIQGLQTSKADKIHNHGIDQVTGLQDALDGKANTVHTHTIANVTGLQGELDNKANVTHTHTIANVTGLQGNLDNINAAIANKADKIHTHVISDVTGLQTALDGHDARIIANAEAIDTKANVVHTHVITDVTGLQDKLTSIDTTISDLDTRVVAAETELENKADKVHTHVIADVDQLQVELDGKALKAHTHAIADTVGLQAELDGKAPLVHDHTIANVTGLEDELNGKADKVHTHDIAEVTGLEDALNGKADVDHTHALSALLDVALTASLAAGQFLSWNGTAWVNVAAPSGGGSTAEGTMFWAGEFITETTYKPFDVVSYSNAVYICTQEAYGVYPDDAAYFELIVDGTGGGGSGGGLARWIEGIDPTSETPGRQQAIFTADMARYTDERPTADNTYLDAVITPAGDGGFSTTTNYDVSGSRTINLSLLPFNTCSANDGILIGGGGSVISTSSALEPEPGVSPEEAAFVHASQSCAIVGGGGNTVMTPSSGTFMALRTNISNAVPGTTGNIVIGGENNVLTGQSVMFANTSNTSSGEAPLRGYHMSLINVDSSEIGSDDTTVVNASNVIIAGGRDINVLGMKNSKIAEGDNITVIGARGVDATDQNNTVVIAGNSTRVYGTSINDGYTTTHVFENGGEAGQTHRFNISASVAQEMPDYSFNLLHVEGNTTPVMNVYHFEIDATFAKDRAAVGTITELVRGDLRSYKFSFTAVHLIQPEGTESSLEILGFSGQEKFTGHTMLPEDVTLIGNVNSLENPTASIKIAFERLHFIDGAEYDVATWTMQLNGSIVESYDVTTVGGMPAISVATSTPNIVGFEPAA